MDARSARNGARGAEPRDAGPARGDAERTGAAWTVGECLAAMAADPEEALRSANRKFESRFRIVETAVRDSGRPWNQFTPAELDALWRTAKGNDPGR